MDDVQEVVFTPLSLRQELGPKVLVEYKDLAMQLANQGQVLPQQGPDAKAKAPVLEKKVEKHATMAGHAEPKSKSGTERRMEARRPPAKTEKSRGGGADSRRGSSAQNLRSGPDDTPKSTKSDSRPERRRTTPVTRAASATGRLPSQAGVRRSRSQETPGTAVRSQKASSVEEDQAGNIRSLEAQVASFRTRNAALEGEVAQLRAEAQAMRKGQDDEIQRLRLELRNKEAQLQQKELEVKKLQAAAAEQHQTVQNFLRRAQVPAPAAPLLAVSGSMTLPPGVTPFTSPRCTTPRLLRPAQTLPVPTTAPTTGTHPVPAPTTPMTAPHAAVQVYTTTPSCLRPGDAKNAQAQAAQVLSFATSTNATNATNRPCAALPVTSVRLTPRQVWYSPGPATAR